MKSTPAFLLALACLALPACTQRSGRAAKELRFFDLVNIDVRDVPMMMALDDLAAHGYTVKTTYLASGALIADALTRGDADIGMANNQTVWTAVSKGANIRSIAGFTASTTVLASKASIATCRDLDGKKLAVAATRGMSPTLLQNYLKQHCAGATPRILVVTESAGRAAALLAGEIDAEIVPREEFLKVQLEAPGKFHTLMSYAEAFPSITIDAFHVRRQWAAENPEGVKDFLRALLRAQRRVTADPELLIGEAVKRLSLAPAVARTIAESHLRAGIWEAQGGLTVKKVEDTLGVLTSIAALPTGIKAEDVADLSFLNAVLQETDKQ